MPRIQSRWACKATQHVVTEIGTGHSVSFLNGNSPSSLSKLTTILLYLMLNFIHELCGKFSDLYLGTNVCSIIRGLIRKIYEGFIV